jgi:hypothetical protein
MVKVAKTYKQFRKQRWVAQEYDIHVNVDAGTMRDGRKVDSVYLQPRKNAFMKDTWVCPTPLAARQLVRRLTHFGDLVSLKLQHCWVQVDFEGLEDLPEAPVDDRVNLKG